jgi:hypothetical protein
MGKSEDRDMRLVTMGQAENGNGELKALEKRVKYAAYGWYAGAAVGALVSVMGKRTTKRKAKAAYFMSSMLVGAVVGQVIGATWAGGAD